MGEAAKIRRGRFAKAIAAAVVTVCFVAAASAADPWKNVDTRPQDMVGTLNCSAVSCHGGGGPRYWGGVAAGGEYVSWLGGAGTFSGGRRHYDPRARLEKSDGDPHALAAQRISEPRFQEVLRRASLKADGTLDAGMYVKCARCHDPGHSFEEIISPATHSATILTPALSQRESGISCETCHGGAKEWVAVHYQRGVNRERLLDLGMVDTKNLLVRARLCVSCHVGSAENDMNHDMIAAGHPPLRFELASYEAMIGRKHWDDRSWRVAEPDYEVQLWAAGRVAAAEGALALLEARARKVQGGEREGSEGRAPWPEFAEGNCFACHQPLRAEVGRTVGPVGVMGKNGVAAWQSWNVGLVDGLIGGRRVGEAELPPEGFGSAIGKLRGAMEASFEPKAEDVVKLAGAARRSLHAAVEVDGAGRVLAVDGMPVGVEQVLKMLVDGRAKQNWDEMCMEVAALAAIVRAMEDRGGGANYEATRERLKRVARGLRFGEAGREWPVVFAAATSNAPAGSAVATIAEARRELDAIRGELMSVTSATIGER